jgi:hypothetical protein
MLTRCQPGQLGKETDDMPQQRTVARLLGIVALIVSSTVGRSTSADQVRYDWSGTLVPTDEGDPWGIGLDGAAFDLQVFVPFGAADLHEVNIDVASYHVSTARLMIDDETLTFVGPATIDFTDNLGDVDFDFSHFGGNFMRFGQTLEFGTSVVLPMDAYTFDQETEPPIAFGVQTNTMLVTCCGGVYASAVPAGTLVEAVAVVPEPRTTMLVLASLVLSVLLAARGHRPT